MDALRTFVIDYLLEKKQQPLSDNEMRRGLLRFLDSVSQREDIRRAVADKVAGVLGRNDQEAIDDIVNSTISDFHENLLQFVRITGEHIVLNRVSGFDPSAVIWTFIGSEIGDFAKRRGWFLLSQSDKQIVLSPNYTNRIENLERVAFHVTSIAKVAKIMKRGLIPQGGVEKDGYIKRTYPNRIYLTTSYNEAEALASMFQGGSYDDPDPTDPQVVLQIDLNKVPEGTKFYSDPEMPAKPQVKGRAVWTYTPIPSDAITIHPRWVKTYKEYVPGSQFT